MFVKLKLAIVTWLWSIQTTLILKPCHCFQTRRLVIFISFVLTLFSATFWIFSADVYPHAWALLWKQKLHLSQSLRQKYFSVLQYSTADTGCKHNTSSFVLSAPPPLWAGPLSHRQRDSNLCHLPGDCLLHTSVKSAATGHWTQGGFTRRPENPSSLPPGGLNCGLAQKRGCTVSGDQPAAVCGSTGKPALHIFTYCFTTISSIKNLHLDLIYLLFLCSRLHYPVKDAEAS